ncbi:MAG TPA: UvrD-helicase domain-containing protein [Spirochaetia bacterium]|nr:UvrD-helicase domain-containing protein [Spirochaetia bacterium]
MTRDYSALLNERQIEAVESASGPLLILAGAGSGKTRVITWRIARLISRGIPQSAILAVTFTNKAAREMAQRIRSMVPGKLSRLTVSTFHAFGAQILREKGHLLGYRPNFTIYDSQDQATLLKDTANELGMKGDALDLRVAAQVISAVKTGRAQWTGENRHLTGLFTEYQRNLKIYNAVDFDDLIVLPTQLLHDSTDVREELSRRYRFILVDEFQDTSTGQYDLLRLLVGEERNVCVVGDDDQSIYSWRGASFENIRRFERDFPDAREIKLEQNYRSTGTILKAANALIANNKGRKPKALWTGLPEGEPIELFNADTEQEEAEFVCSRIRTLMIRESLSFQDFGVLVRANHLTRALEEGFRKENIPYSVSGGMSFFERQEVRDMLAYLKLIANHDDDTSLLRIINTPRRGMGRRLVEHAAAHAAEQRCSLFSALAALASKSELGLEEKARSAAAEFVDLVERFRSRLFTRKGMAAGLREMVEEIDYWGHLVSENRDARDKDVVKWKFGNVESLIGSLADFEEDQDAVNPSLYDYLARVTLASRDDLAEKDEGGRVNLMTIHAAKGLEFPVVFVAGVEQDIIPHARSVEEADTNVEEERRLFYVALTRAERRLFLSWCSSRRKLGKPVEAFPSPFLEELPAACIRMDEQQEQYTPDFASAWKKITGN